MADLEKTPESSYYTDVIGLSIFYLFAYLPVVILFVFAGNMSFFTPSFFFTIILFLGLFCGFFASKQMGQKTQIPNRQLFSGLIIPLPTAVFAIYVLLRFLNNLSKQFTTIVEEQFKGALGAISLPSNIPDPLYSAIGYYACFFLPFLISFFIKKRQSL